MKTLYGKPKETLRLYDGLSFIPYPLQVIMDQWYELSKAEGDKGSCVLGAGFNFDWEGDTYFMPSQSPWQGSLSWEVHIDTIKKLLTDIGATNILYNWGRMD
jgi:hypothetical protein